eukprot:366002-Chlamydomonas_euryale.AAC.4
MYQTKPPSATNAKASSGSVTPRMTARLALGGPDAAGAGGALPSSATSRFSDIWYARNTSRGSPELASVKRNCSSSHAATAADGSPAEMREIAAAMDAV